MRMLIGRNIDRECDRHDVQEAAWVEFLREIARQIVPHDRIQARAEELWMARGKPLGSPDDDWLAAEQELFNELILDPVKLMDSIVADRRKFYVLRGGPLSAVTRIYRYCQIEAFHKYNLQELPFPPLVGPIGPDDLGLQKLASWIGMGEIDASWIVDTWLGSEDRPVWCTDSSLAARGANGIRDALGLKHLDSGFLVEISYAADSLARRGERLRSPTVLDASVSGPANWIFVKNRLAGEGPDWGYTGQLTGSGMLVQGPPEAVHRSFEIDDNDAVEMKLDVFGPITVSPPAVDYHLTLSNPGL